jgi:hypothetical protein
MIPLERMGVWALQGMRYDGMEDSLRLMDKQALNKN